MIREIDTTEAFAHGMSPESTKSLDEIPNGLGRPRIYLVDLKDHKRATEEEMESDSRKMLEHTKIEHADLIADLKKNKRKVVERLVRLRKENPGAYQLYRNTFISPQALDIVTANPSEIDTVTGKQFAEMLTKLPS